VAPLTRIVVDEIKLACKKHPAACGYRSGDNSKLANTVLDTFLILRLFPSYVTDVFLALVGVSTVY